MKSVSLSKSVFSTEFCLMWADWWNSRRGSRCVFTLPPTHVMPCLKFASCSVCVWMKPDISYSSVPQSSIVQKLFKTHQWATAIHWLMCSFITVSTHTVFYFDSHTHTPSWSQKYSLAHALCMALLLKSPKQTHYLLLLEKHLVKSTARSCLRYMDFF